MNRNLSHRLDRLTRQHDAVARRQQVMVEKPPFDVEGFERVFTAFWENQLAGLDPDQVDVRLHEAAAWYAAAIPAETAR